MTDTLRLLRNAIFLLFGFLLGAGATFNAYAESYDANFRYYLQNQPQTPDYPDGASVCAARQAMLSASTVTYMAPDASYLHGSCRITRNSDGALEGQPPILRKGGTCPHGGTFNPTTQKCDNPPPCPEGQTRNPDGSCQAPPCESGRVLDTGLYNDSNGDGITPTTCISGCTANFTPTGAPALHCSFGGDLGTCSYATPGDYIDSGNSCSSGNPPGDKVPKPRNPPCPACDCMESGGSWGTVNGVGVCAPRGAPGTKPITTQPPPKTETTTPAPTPENPNPTPTTTVIPVPTVTEIPAPAGSPPGTPPSITTSTQNPDGSKTETTQTKGQFCEANPTHQICTGIGNGGQGSKFCQENPNVLACQTLGDPPAAEELQTGEVNMSFAPVSLPSMASCPTDIAFSFMTGTVSYDWLCQYANAMRPFMIAGAYLTAALIIFGFRGNE